MRRSWSFYLSIDMVFCPRIVNSLPDDQRRSRHLDVAQVALRWLLQQNVAAIPRSSNPQRIADNFKMFDFMLTDDEMKRISALKRQNSRIANPVERVSGGWD